MKRSSVACVLGFLSAGLFITAAPASADTAGCVTKKEFRNVHSGDRKKHVHNVFDTDGKRDLISVGYGSTFEIRSYRACGKWREFSIISVAYDDKRLDSKTAVWVAY